MGSVMKGTLLQRVGCCLAVALLTAGCGRKEPPQPTIEKSPPPAITSLSYEQNYNSIKVTMRLAGGGGVLGYQVDIAQIDPICHCPTAWRRDYELQPRSDMDNRKVIRIITLHRAGVKFLYRIRAVDALGRLSRWSDTIHATPVEKF
ncbi:MAG: hypothetical protein Q9M13_09165 [Mariprofundales bacterium]|nr:hypothetical protein [Mariprofundales bacterium]